MIEYINNFEKFNRDFSRSKDAMKRGLRKGANISGDQLVKQLIKDMRLPKTGRVYSTRIGKRGAELKSLRRYNASSPNQVPAIVTGEFRRSLGFEVQGSSRLVFGSGKDGMAKYAKFLEEGTSRMKARKPLQRTAKKMNNQIDKNLIRMIRKEYRAIGIKTKKIKT